LKDGPPVGPEKTAQGRESGADQEGVQNHDPMKKGKTCPFTDENLISGNGGRVRAKGGGGGGGVKSPWSPRGEWEVHRGGNNRMLRIKGWDLFAKKGSNSSCEGKRDEERDTGTWATGAGRRINWGEKKDQKVRAGCDGETGTHGGGDLRH